MNCYWFYHSLFLEKQSNTHPSSHLSNLPARSNWHCDTCVVDNLPPYRLIIMAPHPISPISCLRCTSFGIQCCVVDVPSASPCPKHLCNQCYAAGMVQCIFPPSIRLIDNTPSNSKCISCSTVKSKCIFTNANDGQCVRCSKLCIPCCMKLKGKCMCWVYWSCLLLYGMLIWSLFSNLKWSFGISYRPSSEKEI